MANMNCDTEKIYKEISKYRENDIDKIIFACKEADCGNDCRLYVNISSDHQQYFKKNRPEDLNLCPVLCPLKLVTPIWKYEGIQLIKQKVDETVVHG